MLLYSSTLGVMRTGALVRRFPEMYIIYLSTFLSPAGAVNAERRLSTFAFYPVQVTIIAYISRLPSFLYIALYKSKGANTLATGSKQFIVRVKSTHHR